MLDAGTATSAGCSPIVAPKWSGSSPANRCSNSLNHPCFEQLRPSWLRHGEYRTTQYLAEYEIQQTHAPDFHRTVSAYLNETIRLGRCLTEVAEPGLDPEVAATADGVDAYIHLPNFMIIRAQRHGPELAFDP
jgi:hypothetical protein